MSLLGILWRVDRQPLVGEEAEFTARVGAVVPIVGEVHVVDTL